MYREQDVEIIDKNLGKLEDKAREIYINNYEPTIQETRSVYSIIKDYIRKNKLIVYGGYAQNALIKKQNEKDAFYKESDLADIEFYSPEPLKDLINLCDLLHNKNFKHIEGKEGVHNETYKIFVNFHNYLDLSYLPKNVYNHLPTITLEGMKMTHPQFMIMDAYRVYTDPMSSYFRLTKTFSRFNKLIEHYPFNKNSIYNEVHFDVNISEKEYDNLNYFIRKQIVQRNKLIMIGFQAFNRLMKKAKMPTTHFIQEQYYQLISHNYNNDKEKFFNLLNKKFSNISKKHYHKYSQFLDETTEYYYKEQLILRLYGNNEKCNVYKYSKKKKTYYGTIQLQLLYLLIHYNIGIIRNNNFTQTFNLAMITRLLKARNRYLEDHNLTVLDDSPFQEFTMDCLGEPKDLLRSSMLQGLENRKKGKPMKFAYRPKGTPGKVPEYRFNNTSGELKNKK